jgi:hypothetical protein
VLFAACADLGDMRARSRLRTPGHADDWTFD